MQKMEKSQYGSIGSTAEQSPRLKSDRSKSISGRSSVGEHGDEHQLRRQDSYTLHMNKIHPSLRSSVRYSELARTAIADNKYTIELSQDVFSFVLSSKISGTFDKWSKQSRFLWICTCLGVSTMQIFLLAGVSYYAYLDGHATLGDEWKDYFGHWIMKILASGALALYYMKEMRSLLPVYMVQSLIRTDMNDYKLLCRRPINDDYSVCCIDFRNITIDLAWIYWYVIFYQWFLGIAFLITSVVVISVNETAPEILSCCLDMTFIMQIDDWAFQALTFTFVNEYDLNFEFDFVHDRLIKDNYNKRHGYNYTESIDNSMHLQHSLVDIIDDIDDDGNTNINNADGDTDEENPLPSDPLLATKDTLENAKQEVIKSEKEYRYSIFWWSRSFAIMALYAGMIAFVYVDIYFLNLKALLTQG